MAMMMTAPASPRFRFDKPSSTYSAASSSASSSLPSPAASPSCSPAHSPRLTIHISPLIGNASPNQARFRPSSPILAKVGAAATSTVRRLSLTNNPTRFIGIMIPPSFRRKFSPLLLLPLLLFFGIFLSVQVDGPTQNFNTKWRLAIRDRNSMAGKEHRFGRIPELLGIASRPELVYKERMREEGDQPFLPPDAPPLLDAREGFESIMKMMDDDDNGSQDRSSLHFGGGHQLDPTNPTGLKERLGLLHYSSSTAATTSSSTAMIFPNGRKRITSSRSFTSTRPPLPLFEPGSYIAQDAGILSLEQQNLQAQQRRTAIAVRRAALRNANQLLRLDLDRASSSSFIPIIPPIGKAAGPAGRQLNHPPPPVIEYYPNTNLPLAPNAAAMLRAEREHIPFRPSRPREMVAEQRERERIKAENDRLRKEERLREKAEKDRNRFWFMQDSATVYPPPLLATGNDAVTKLGAADAAIAKAAAARKALIDLRKKRLRLIDDARRKAIEDEAEKIRLNPVVLSEEELAMRAFIMEDEGDFEYLVSKDKVDQERKSIDDATLETEAETADGTDDQLIDEGLLTAEMIGIGGGSMAKKRKKTSQSPQHDPLLTRRSIITSSANSNVSDNSNATVIIASGSPSAFENSTIISSDSSDHHARRLLTRSAHSESQSAQASDQLHPISFLIREADDRWNLMLQRQSQTLAEAVEEYQRRYNRNPPAGFDRWWRYAMEHRIVLVDEYDQIDSDITPFLPLPSHEFRRRVNALSSSASPSFRSSFTLQLKEGNLFATGPRKGLERVEDTMDLIGQILKDMKDMQMTYTSHDGPNILVTAEGKERHLEAVRINRVLQPSEYSDLHEDPIMLPWQAACSSNSSARKAVNGQVITLPLVPRDQLSYISTDHESAMDFCKHPEIQYQHGYTAWQGPKAQLISPIFSYSKTSMHSDLLVPSVEQYFSEVGHDPIWAMKKKNQVLWRGSTTGSIEFSKRTNWRATQRTRLVRLTSESPGSMLIHHSTPSGALTSFTAPVVAINDFYFDVAFAGQPVQCNKEDGTCKKLQDEYRFEEGMSPAEQNVYKYVIDTDGNGVSARFHRLMSSRSLVFKSTVFVEWWTKRLMPWYHYIPIKNDYSDLHDAAAYFIGAPDGTGSHDSVAQRIASQGKKWADEHWREVDMAAYHFRLYLEYARLLSRDQEGSHDFTLE